VNHFGIKPYQPPSAPAFLVPFTNTCNMLMVQMESDLSVVQVGPSVDPEGAAIMIQLQIADYDQPTSTPIFDQMQPNTTPYATFNTSSVPYAAGTRYKFQTRAYDGMAYSNWVQCDAIWGTPDAGNGGGGGNGSGGNGGHAGKTGCSSTTGPDVSGYLLLGLGLVGLLRRRRRS
jgi:MYXO-CTERM domain-containing protein